MKDVIKINKLFSFSIDWLGKSYTAREPLGALHNKLNPFRFDTVGRSTYRRQARVCFLLLVAQDSASACSGMGVTIQAKTLPASTE